MTNISREVLALTGGAPPITLKYPSYKDRPTFLSASTRWEFRPFSNPARNDSLLLCHWSKDASNVSEFAKFNKSVDVVTYTDEEYTTYLQDPDWSKEETDYLIHLSKLYDLRFIVISDRYSFEEKSRTIEDLKDRYYKICQVMFTVRNPDIDPHTSDEYKSFLFIKDREVERKENLDILYKRTATEAAEEERLFHELKRREQQQKRWQKERDALIRLLSSYDSSHAAQLAAAELATKKKRKLKEENDKETPVKKKKDKSEPPTPDDSKKEKIPPGVYLRGQKLTAIKQAYQPKVLSMLEEFGIGTRPKMPTAQVMQKYDELRQSLVALLELKKLLDRTEQDLKIAISRKQTLEALEPEDRKAEVLPSPSIEKRRSISLASVSSAREKRR